MKNLFIVESPGKVKKISQILGADWIVKASVGHIRDLPKNRMGVEAPEFRPEYEATDRGAEVISSLKKLSKQAPEVWLATDMDREGESIAWHLKEALGLKNPKRIRFDEITEKAINEAIQHPSVIDTDMVAAQEARRVLDRLIGFSFSPLLTRLEGETGLSAGRVQSPATRIVVEREKEIQEFKPTTHYGAKLTFDDWSAELDTTPFLEKGQYGGEYLFDYEIAERAAAVSKVAVTSCEEKQRQKQPPPPFITSSLQQAASSHYGWSPKKTMEVAQKLYEDGSITYMRTDKPNLSDDALIDILNYSQSVGIELADTPRVWKSKGGAQEAHEAIRPTHMSTTAGGNTEEEAQLYELIWRRTLACQMPAAIYDTRTVTLQSPDSLFTYKAKGEVLAYEGWKSIYRETEETEETPANPVPATSSGETLIPTSGEVLTKKTRAPSRFTEASLIAELERLGIGRPSTYAAIMETIINVRKYLQIKKESKYITPTDRGERVIDAMKKYRLGFIEYSFTEETEELLDKVAMGEITYKQLVSAMNKNILSEVSYIQANASVKNPCPACGNPLIRRKGKKGYFWGCSDFPTCKETLPDKESSPVATRTRRRKITR